MNCLNKILHLPLLCVIILAGCLVSCINENIPDVPTSGNENLYYGKKETLYFSFRLNMADGIPSSRAEDDEKEEPKYGIHDFEDKTPDIDNRLNRVNNVLILFYDEDGNYLAHFDSQTMNNHKYKDDPKEESESDEETDNDDEVDDAGEAESEGVEGDEGSDKKEEKDPEIPIIEEWHWSTTLTVPVEIYNSVKDKKFHSFYAIINYDDNIRDQFITTTKIDGEDVEYGISRLELLSTNLTTTSYMTDMGFLMTTPGYYSKSDSNCKYLHYAILDSQKTGEEFIFNTKAEAEKHPIDVYVERLAAKVVLANVAEADEIEVLYGTDVYGLTFESEAWALQGLETYSFLTKHGSDELTITGVNSIYTSPRDFFNWINFTDNPRRTFWAESPNFLSSSSDFPVTYTYPVTGLETKNDVTLEYNTYGNITTNEKNKILSNSGVENSFYTLEHTFQSTELTDVAENPYAVPTSIVLAGRYKKAKYIRTDDIYKDDSNSPSNKPDDISFNDKGFYLRHIDMERTDKEGSTTDDKNNPVSKKYQYRLYLEDNGNTGNNSNLKNDLYVALVKEQHTVFVYSETYHSYTNDNKDFIEEYNGEYIPVKENTTYYSVVLIEAKDEFGNVRKDKDNNTIYVKENVPHTISASDILGINNSHRRWYNNKWVDASNTYTLQLLTDLDQGSIPELYCGIYPSDNPTLGEVAKYKKIIKDGEENEEVIPVKNVNLALQKQLGYAQFYEKGKAFFYSPLIHYVNPAFYNENSPFRGQFFSQGSIDEATGITTYNIKNRTGEFGIVRNHVYHFSVDAIKSLGYGIPGDNYIPLPEPILGKDIYYFDLELKILPWNVFDMQIDI